MTPGAHIAPETPSHPLSDDPRRQIAEVGRRLSGSLIGVLEALPGAWQRPNQLAGLLGLNRDISGRALSVARSEDPLTAAHIAPGPEPLRKLLRAARRKGVAGDLIVAAEQAVQAFEDLIRDQAGDRPALDAIISSLLPNARPKFELAAKQTIFKGTSLLKGAMADCWVHASLVHPSSVDDAYHDVVYVYGTLGLRRVRPDATVKFFYRQFGTPTHDSMTLDGRPIRDGTGRILDQFCIRPPAVLDATPTDNGTVFALAGNDIGPHASSDKLLSEVRPCAMARSAADRARRLKSLFVAPSVPVKLLHFDVLLHEDVYPGAEPSLLVYDTTVEGMASVNDPSRDADRLDVHESVTVLGRGVDRLPMAEMSTYVPMLQFVCEKRGWDLDRFRGYRCRIQYPMHGSQAAMVFEVG